MNLNEDVFGSSSSGIRPKRDFYGIHLCNPFAFSINSFDISAELFGSFVCYTRTGGPITLTLGARARLARQYDILTMTMACSYGLLMEIIHVDSYDCNRM